MYDDVQNIYDGQGDVKPHDDWCCFSDILDDGNIIIMQYTGLKDRNGKEIYEGDIVAYIRESIYHFLDREGVEPSKGIWYDKKEGVNNTPAFSEKVIYGRKCEVVKWQEDMTGFYPFADSPDNCGHCGGGYKPEMFEVIGNIYENPELLTESP